MLRSLAIVILFAFAQAHAKVTFDGITIDANTFLTKSNGDVIFNPDGTGAVKFPDLTASRLVYIDSSGYLKSLGVTDTEALYLSGVTSSIQTQIDALSSGTTAALAAHEADTTSVHGIADTANLVTLAGSQTLTNKTLTTPIISVILNSGTLTLPTSSDTLVGRATTDTLTNKTIDGDNNTVQDLGISSLKTNVGAANTFISRDGSGVVISTKSVPTGDVVGTSDTQGLTNKICENCSINLGLSYLDEALAKFYEDGSGTNYAAIKAPASLSADYTLTLPTTDGNSNQVLTTDGSGVLSWADQGSAPSAPYEISNFGLGFSVSASALTIAVKQSDGSTDASSISPVKVGIRSATSGSGAYSQVSITSSLGLTVPSGATLGCISGSNCYVFVYVLSNSGTPEIAVNSQYEEDGVITTTAIGAGSDTSGFYSASARTNVGARFVGWFKYNTAPNGTYSAAPDLVKLATFGQIAPVIEYYSANSGIKTPGASGNYLSMTTNSLTLQPGQWLLKGQVGFANSGSSPTYSSWQALWASANGGDSGSAPASLTAISGSSLQTSYDDSGGFGSPNFYMTASGPSSSTILMPDVIITLTSTATVYLVPRPQMTTAGNARVRCNLSAVRIK